MNYVFHRPTTNSNVLKGPENKITFRIFLFAFFAFFFAGCSQPGSAISPPPQRLNMATTPLSPKTAEGPTCLPLEKGEKLSDELLYCRTSWDELKFFFLKKMSSKKLSVRRKTLQLPRMLTRGARGWWSSLIFFSCLGLSQSEIKIKKQHYSEKSTFNYEQGISDEAKARFL